MEPLFLANTHSYKPQTSDVGTDLNSTVKNKTAKYRLPTTLRKIQSKILVSE